MIDQYGRALFNPKPSAYSRTVLGPVESTDPRRAYEVTGELLVPRHRPTGPGSMFHSFEVEKLCYRQVVAGHMLQNGDVRQMLERQVRRSLADALVDRFTIPMRVEELW